MNSSLGTMLLGIPAIIVALSLAIINFVLPVIIAILLIKALLKYLNEGKGSDPVIKRSVGDVIKKYREAKGLTQEFVAESLGVSRQAVSKWETGRSEPSTSNLFALARLFDVPIEDFMKEIQV